MRSDTHEMIRVSTLWVKRSRGKPGCELWKSGMNDPLWGGARVIMWIKYGWEEQTMFWSSIRANSLIKKIKFMYLLPSFHPPTVIGKHWIFTMSLVSSVTELQSHSVTAGNTRKLFSFVCLLVCFYTSCSLTSRSYRAFLSYRFHTDG